MLISHFDYMDTKHCCHNIAQDPLQLKAGSAFVDDRKTERTKLASLQLTLIAIEAQTD